MGLQKLRTKQNSSQFSNQSFCLSWSSFSNLPPFQGKTLWEQVWFPTEQFCLQHVASTSGICYIFNKSVEWMNKRIKARCRCTKMKSTQATVLPTAWEGNVVREAPRMKDEQSITSRWRRGLVWWPCRGKLWVMVRCSRSGRERRLNPGIKSPVSEYTQMPKAMMSSQTFRDFKWPGSNWLTRQGN